MSDREDPFSFVDMYAALPLSSEARIAELEQQMQSLLIPRGLAHQMAFCHDDGMDLYESTGDRRLRNIQDALHSFTYNGEKITPSQTQTRFLKEMLKGALNAIYGDEFESALHRIKEEWKFDEVRQEVIITTSRGEGKSWCVAMFTAAILMYCPNVKITIFAVALRAAINLISLIDQFLSEHPLGKQMVRRPHARESLTLVNPENPTDVRVVTALPSKSEVRCPSSLLFDE